MSGNDWSTHPFPPDHHLHFSPLRRIQEHQDSDGVTHLVLVQTEEMSCGIACAAMLIDLWHRASTPGGPEFERRLKEIAGRFPGSMVEQDRIWGSQGPNSHHEGSQVTNIERLLLHEHIPITAVWHGWRERTGTNALERPRIRHRPALLLWGWYDAAGQTRSGGHFTVAARVTTAGRIVILDPWDGSMSEITRTQRYKVSGMLDAAVYTG